ncbi:Hypothetical predicted protein [Cloeon dipterum]|uniref:Filamin-A n=1 Tax=Cloeon dipterum TaxID=197152 RepID=A0A8S1DWQ0_9INSE|nr:Hypothetical predicted protein [Cloeon dipterum]
MCLQLIVMPLFLPQHTCRVHKAAQFKVECLEENVEASEVRAEVVGPSGRVESRFNMTSGGGQGSCTPTEVGMYQLLVYCEGELIQGCPTSLRVMPEVTSISYPGMEPCAIGSIVEVLVNSYGARNGQVEVMAHSPTGRNLECPVQERDGVYTANFQPDEAGEWQIHVLHGGQNVQGGPYTCFVFDPNGVRLEGLEGATPGRQHSFICDTSATGGLGDVVLDIALSGRSVQHQVDEIGPHRYKVSFLPAQPGKYKVYVYFNGQEVRGSAFSMRIGSYRSTKQHSKQATHHSSSFSEQNRSSSFARAGRDSPDRINRDQLTKEMSRVTMNSRLTQEERHTPPAVNPSDIYAVSTKKLTAPAKVTSTLTTHLRAVSPVRSPSPARFNPSPITYSATVKHSDSFSNDYTSVTESRFQQHSSFTSGSRLLNSGGSPPQLLNGSAHLLRATPSPKPLPGQVDTSSNVRVSSMLNNLNQRRDSWDAIAKTKSLLSYGSLESVANVHNTENHVHSTYTSRPSGYTLSTASPTVESTEPRLVAVHRQASVLVPSQGLDAGDLSAYVSGPYLSSVPCSVTPRPPHHLAVNFVPKDIGEHVVELRNGDHRVAGSPIKVHAYNSQAIQVGRIPDGSVGRSVEFEIDGSRAGSGNLEILVNGGHVTSFVRDLGNQRFLASFVPHEPGSHLLEMTFNGEQVPGSPWQVAVGGSPAASGMATTTTKMTVVGEAVRLVAVGTPAAFEISAPGLEREQVQVQIMSPSKRAVASRVTQQGGQLRVQFTPKEVGSHLVEVGMAGRSLPGGPLVAKVYNAGLIRVTDVTSGVVGQPCQFKVDASQAGEGQLEISVNEGEVPNHVAVVGGGRCLVTFTPETAKPHAVDIKFNGEPVPGSPFSCHVGDPHGGGRVTLGLRGLELVAVDEPAKFHMAVDGSGGAELAVAVRSPSGHDLPVKVTGNVHAGFTAEFTPREVGGHAVSVEYNGHAVSGTPFVAKAFDAKRVFVGALPSGSVGKSLHFTVDASQAGEGNLEITISARGHNIPTQVHPQGNARFTVSFIPVEAFEHLVSIAFNKTPVPGSPFVARVAADPHHVVVSGQHLASAAVGKPAYFTMSNVNAALDDVEVNVEGPNGQSVAAQVKDNGDNSFKVEFSPRSAGEHRIAVSVLREPVPGSPFACKAYDVRAIRVNAAATGCVAKPVTFLVETSQAGPGNLEVTVNGGRVPTSAQAQGIHTYAISFTPREASPHTVELRFNGEDVPGSPFAVEISEAARIVPGAEEKVPVGRRAHFWLQAAQAKPVVTVLSPGRKSLAVEVAEPAVGGPNAGQINVSFTPEEVGDHSVEVKVADAHVEGSPFLLKAYDSNKVKVTDVTSGIIGKPVYFSINASQAGAGNLEIIVSVNGRNVPNYVQSEGNARFRVNFKPQEAAVHLLSVRFNGHLVPGSPFECRVAAAGQAVVSGTALRQAALGKPALLTVEPHDALVRECNVTVLAPSGQNVPTVVSGSAHDKFFATFTPFEVGRHAVSVVLDSEHVKGSPFASNVYDVSQVKVTGLQATGVVSNPVTFEVDAAEAGEGTLELVVSTAQGTVKAEVAAVARGLYKVTFVPTRAEPHFVHVSFNEEDVPGSPFEWRVAVAAGETARMERPAAVRGEGLRWAVVGAPAFFDVDPGGPSEPPPQVEVLGPDGAPLAVRLAPVAASGRLRAEYRPVAVGLHQVWVRRAGLAAADNPFELEVFDPAQASLAHVSDAVLGQPCTLTIDASKAGRANLQVVVTAAGREVKAAVRDVGHGRHEVSFLPSICTPHRVDVKLNGLPVAGCPTEVAVRDAAAGRDLAATGKGLFQAEAGAEAAFTILTLARPAREFDVVISGPAGIAIPVRCYQQKDGNLLAQYTPPGAGAYKVEVLHGTKAVKGSPFFCQVYDPSKVRIASPKDPALVHQPLSFHVLRKGAGFAELDVTATSPLGQNLPLQVTGGEQPESDMITFTPSAPGQYRFSIRYGGREVPGSPVTFVVSEEGLAQVAGDSTDGNRMLRSNGVDYGEVTLSGPALEGCRVGRETYFLINSSKPVPGNPEASLSLDGVTYPVSIKPEGARVHRATFTPVESGHGKLRVEWAGRQVKGSPFSVLVSSAADARQVVCSGEGLRVGTVGKEIRSFIDTRRAGPGELTAQCVGPNKVAYCELYDHGDGTFTLNVKPQEPGKHALSIKYGGQHVPGSPFSLKVAGSPDASKVRVFGPGIEHGVLATFQSRFVCDTRGAGAGQLTVRIRGPKGAFRVEMQRESQRDRSILCKYEPTEPGDYKLEVKWAGQHVPGSPFSVMIFDTQEELNKFMQGNGSPPGAPALSEVYGYTNTAFSQLNINQPQLWRDSQAQL